MLLGVALSVSVRLSLKRTFCASQRRYRKRYANFPSRFAFGSSFPLEAYKKKNTAYAVFSFYGAPSGIRTRDPLIKSQLLYQLS